MRSAALRSVPIACDELQMYFNSLRRFVPSAAMSYDLFLGT
jgi:hypothetical protein